MKKILILMGRYLPGYKDGGPLRTVINMTEALGDEYKFYIVCLDRDHGDKVPYSDIKKSQWNVVGKAKVWYVQPGGFTFSLLRRLAKDKDVIYTCGFYDDYGYKTLLLNAVGLLYEKPVFVASMGSFSPGALSQKALKKKVFIALFKLLGLFRKVTWSVTSELEAEDMKNNIGASAIYVVAEDLPRSVIPGRIISETSQDALKVIFLSRISPIKNLLGAISILSSVKSKIFFTIYGPKEDSQYWDRCQKQLKALPPNISWEYKGEIPTEEVQSVFLQNDIFLFPSLGENYAHVIFEALSVGCIPVISDRTPWNHIAQQGVGYVFPLDELFAFSEAIDELAVMSIEKRVAMSRKCVELARKKLYQARKETGYRQIFG